MEVELEVLRSGTIRDLFSAKRNIPARKLADPTALPEIKTQCVHVESEMLSEGVYYTRCMNDATANGRHGWLCAEHGQDPWIWSPRPYRDKDAEMVEGIILHEQRMLANTPREVIGGKSKIQFVAGVRMKNDVNADGIEWE